MPYLVRGNAQQLASLFGAEWLFAEAETPTGSLIEADLPRTFFLGSKEDAEHHVQGWGRATQSSTYAQGDMSAANSFFFLTQNNLFKKENEEQLDYQKNFVALSFAYVNKQKELCGLTIYYRKDNPSQWLIASSNKSSSDPQTRQIALLANFDLKPYFAQNHSEDLAVEVVDRIHNPLVEQIQSPFTKQILEQGLFADHGAIDSKMLRISHLLRMINLNGPELLNDPIALEMLNVQQLFAENPSLDLITNYKLPISSKLLLDCLSEPSGLRKEIEALKLTDNPTINACLLSMVIHFYEKGVLNDHRELLETQLINKTRTGTIWNHDQIQLIPFLVQKKYAPELLQQILSKKAYYTGVKELIKLGLTQDIPELFLKADKIVELDFIDKVDDNSLKQLCLIFWVKGVLSYSEYQTIIKAAETYPLLAQTLIALDKTGEVSIKDLKALALDPQKHLQQSIIHHFANDYSVNKVTLNKLSITELTQLNESFVILKGKKDVTPEAYDVVARHNEQGQLFRQFLPTLNTIYNVSYRNTLIDLLYEGIQKGPLSLDKKIAAISDNRLHVFATDLRNRVNCAKQMQKLHLNDELITMAAEDTSGAKRFRKVILKVEDACKKINTRIDANADIKQRKAWQDAEKEYRQILYAMAHQTIKDPTYDYAPILEKAQNKMLDIVDPEVKSWLQKALIFVANVFIYALTGGYANTAKEKRTGNFWFFNHSDSGDELRYLEGELKEQIKGPK